MNALAKRSSVNVSVALVFQAVIYFSLSLIIGRLGIDRTSALMYVVQAMFSVAVNLIPLIVLRRMNATLSGGTREKPSGSDGIRRGDKILITAGVSATVFAIGVLYERVFPDAASVITAGKDVSVWMNLLAVATVCVLPAMFEELFFRGAVLEHLSVAGYVPATIISAMSFALAHFSSVRFPFAFIAGLFFGALYAITGSVKYTIAAHFACNFTSFLFIFAKTVVPPEPFGKFELASALVFLFVSVLITIATSKNAFRMIVRKDGAADASSILTPAILAYFVIAMVATLFFVRGI